MQSLLKRLLRDKSAVTVVEYGLLVGTLSIAIILGLSGFANQVVNLWEIVDTYTVNAQNRN